MDLDGDNVNDLLSGSWPGEIFFFRGKGKGDFDAPVKLKHKDGKSINPMGGVTREGDGRLLVRGDGKFEKKDGKQFIVYEGEWIEVKPTDSAGITGSATAVFAHDADADGDFDLLIGDIRGNVHLVPNEGSKTQWAFGKPQELSCAGGTVKVKGDAGPFVADWDGDGAKDLLVGSGDGSVWLYPGTGKDGKLALAAGRALVPPAGEMYGDNTPTEPTRGMRTKVCAADWNGDGRLDLLVGDYTTQKPAPKEYTAEEKAEHAKARAEMEPLQKKYGELVQNFINPKQRQSKTPEQMAQIEKELGEVSKKMGELRDKIPPESETHGWVWLYLRKPADQANAGARAG